MSIIEKTQIHNYEDKYNDEYIAKGGYLISDLVDFNTVEMRGGGVGINAVRDFFTDLAVPSGLYVFNTPQSAGSKTKVMPRVEVMDDTEFNNLLKEVFVSNHRGGSKTHKKTESQKKPLQTRKKTM